MEVEGGSVTVAGSVKAKGEKEVVSPHTTFATVSTDVVMSTQFVPSLC